MTRKVAVKVIRPGVRKLFFRDLESYFLASRLQEKYIPSSRRLRPVEVTQTLAQTTKIEMDLRLEAAALSELGENTANDPGFRVPAVDWVRTGRDVLTMEWVDGIKMNDVAALREAGHDLVGIAANLVQSFLRHTLRDGFFHADMHPGNLFVEADGTIVAVDLGITGRLGKKERRFLAEILFGFITRDYARVAEVHFEAGYVPRTHSVTSFAQAIRAIGEPIHGQPAETISMAKLLTLLFEVTELFDMADAAGADPAAEDHGGRRGRGAHARSGLQHVEDLRAGGRRLDPRQSRAARHPGRRPRRRLGAGVAGPPGAGPRRPHGAAVARDRPDGRARPALRRADRQGNRQGGGARDAIGPRRAVGDRGGGGVSGVGDYVRAETLRFNNSPKPTIVHSLTAMTALHTLLGLEAAMATITVRNVDEETRRNLRLRAARKGVSMEQEVRTILAAAVKPSDAANDRSESLYDAIRKLVEPHGGFRARHTETRSNARTADVRVMFLLDTNVISEMFRPARHAGVQQWFATHPKDRLFVSSISKAELLFGLAVMQTGRRKLALADVMWNFFSRELRTDILSFGSKEAEFFAEIAANRRSIGRPISEFDAQIAAIARSHQFAVITRNVSDFEHCCIDVINPWDDQ